MHPRSMFFTLYGVYIRHFGAEAPLSTVVRLMTEFGFQEAAIRAALARLAAQGWLQLRKSGRNSYLALTERGWQRVDEAASRIYRLRPARWDGQWLLVTYTIPEEQRAARDQLRSDLEWWGFGPLAPGTWLSPHPLSLALQERLHSPEVRDYLQVFQARNAGRASDRELVRKGWDLSQVNGRYRQFLDHFKPLYLAAWANCPDDQSCFQGRSRLVHEYRKFLFNDPGLPDELLDEDWLGSEAFSLFQAYDQLLANGAGRYFYSLYAAAPGLRMGLAMVEAGLRGQLNPFGGIVSEPAD